MSRRLFTVHVFMLLQCLDNCCVSFLFINMSSCQTLSATKFPNHLSYFCHTVQGLEGFSRIPSISLNLSCLFWEAYVFILNGIIEKSLSCFWRDVYTDLKISLCTAMFQLSLSLVGFSCEGHKLCDFPKLEA